VLGRIGGACRAVGPLRFDTLDGVSLQLGAILI